MRPNDTTAITLLDCRDLRIHDHDHEAYHSK